MSTASVLQDQSDRATPPTGPKLILTWPELAIILAVRFAFTLMQQIHVTHWVMRVLMVLAVILVVAVIWVRLLRAGQKAGQKPDQKPDSPQAWRGLRLSPATQRGLIRWGGGVIMLLVALVGLRSIVLSIERDRIRLDQGETSYNAARYVWAGGNPYDRFALIDHTAYWQYRDEHRRTTPLDYAATRQELKNYFLDFDGQKYRQLLPQTALNQENLNPANPVPNLATDKNWTHPLGYKYGPVILLAHVLTVPILERGAVMLLNTLVFLLYVGMVKQMVEQLTPHRLLAIFAMFLAASEANTRAMLGNSATDIYPIAFLALAWWGWLSGRGWVLGSGLALALMSKMIPSVLALPLLLLPYRAYQKRQIIQAILCLIGVGLGLAVPFMVADGRGFWENYLWWPFLMSQDGSGWSGFLPHFMPMGLRVLAGTVIALGWLWLYARQNRRKSQGIEADATLALLALGWFSLSLGLIMVSGTVLHSNYFTWLAGFALIFVLVAATFLRARESPI